MPKSFLDAINQAEAGSSPQTIVVPDGNITLVDTTSAQAISGKTLTVTGGTFTSPVLVSPVIVAPTGTENVIAYTADGAIAITNHVAYITKAGSAAAMTVAAPGAGAGARITIVTGSAFAHVVTFTGATLNNGLTTPKTTVTFTAVIGSAITVIATTAGLWVLESSSNVTSIA
jgi:hypothetical protein